MCTSDSGRCVNVTKAVRRVVLLVHIFFVGKEADVYVVDRWLGDNEVFSLTRHDTRRVPHIYTSIATKITFRLRIIKKP